MEGSFAGRFFPEADNNQYRYHHEDIDILMKVETHNHPTAIAPFSGAATGSGGEIRDLWITPKGDTTKSHKPDHAAINQHATLNPVKKMDAGPEDIECEVDVKLE